MKLCQIYAALARVNEQIVTAPNSVARDALIVVRGNLKQQIKGAR